MLLGALVDRGVVREMRCCQVGFELAANEVIVLAP